MDVRKYSEDDFIDEEFGDYEPSESLRHHDNCCGIEIIYQDGRLVNASMINRLVQEVIYMQDDVSIELVLTQSQIKPESAWDSPVTLEKKRVAISMLKHWDFKIRSSFVNPNSGNECYVFFRNSEGKRNLPHAWYTNSK